MTEEHTSEEIKYRLSDLGVQIGNIAIEYIADLEKKNAELKEKLKPENCLKLLAKDGYVKFTSDQLTEAKEIIKGLMRFARCFAQHHLDDCRYTDAKEFLAKTGE